MEALTDLLGANPYPGRGLACVGTPGGALVAYFVTGRSAASKEREIKLDCGGALVVAPLGEGADDPLRHYAAATTSTEWLVCGNGRQVTTVVERLSTGQAPALALDDLDHEPDEPIFTDRITLLVSRDRPVTVVFGVARRSSGGRSTSDILTRTIRQPAPGDGVLLTTYRSDGPTIEGAQPVLEGRCDASDAAGFLDAVWEALDERFRVAAVVIDPAGSLDEALIRNQRSDEK